MDRIDEEDQAKFCVQEIRRLLEGLKKYIFVLIYPNSKNFHFLINRSLFFYQLKLT